VLAVACPPLGSDIGLTFFLPRLSRSIAAVRMEAEGTVIRIEGEQGADKSGGFAVLTTAAILRNNGKYGRNGARKPAKPNAQGQDRA